MPTGYVGIESALGSDDRGWFLSIPPPPSHPDCWISDWMLNTWKSTYLAAWIGLSGRDSQRQGLFGVVLYMGILPWRRWLLVRLLCWGVRELGNTGGGSGGGCPQWVAGMSFLGTLSSPVPCGSRRALLLVAPGQLVMSVLKTRVCFSKRFEPVLICLVALVSPQAPHAEQDCSAAGLLTMLDRLFVAG